MDYILAPLLQLSDMEIPCGKEMLTKSRARVEDLVSLEWKARSKEPIESVHY